MLRMYVYHLSSWEEDKFSIQYTVRGNSSSFILTDKKIDPNKEKLSINRPDIQKDRFSGHICISELEAKKLTLTDILVNTNSFAF